MKYTNYTNLRIAILVLCFVLLLPASVAANTKPWLGVIAEDFTNKEIDELGLNYGIRIREIINDSPATRADLKQGDILLDLDNQPLLSVDRLQWIVDKKDAGNTLTVKYKRGNLNRNSQVTLGDWQAFASQKVRASHSNTLSSYLGVHLQDLNQGLREFFGTPENIGVLITEVESESAAARAGLKVGDVIVSMGPKIINGMTDVRRVLDFFDPDESLDVSVMRYKEQVDISIALDSKYHSEESYISAPKHSFDSWHWSYDPHADLSFEYNEELHHEPMPNFFHPIMEHFHSKLEISICDL